MDDSPDDQRLPHRQSPNKPCALAALRRLGVLSWRMDADAWQSDPKLAAVRKVRGYSYSEVIEISKDKLPGYDEKIRMFYEEHIHDDEEVRCCRGGVLLLCCCCCVLLLCAVLCAAVVVVCCGVLCVSVFVRVCLYAWALGTLLVCVSVPLRHMRPLPFAHDLPPALSISLQPPPPPSHLINQPTTHII